jgi:putative PEP-CTERM system integral membrane protein
MAFMLLGFAPQLLPEVLSAVRTGEIPTAFLVYGVTLSAIPVAAIVVGATVLRRSPGRLLAFGYGVEGPLMLVLLVRFFVIRQVMPPVILLLSVAGAGLVTLLWQILDCRIDARGPLLAHARLVGLALLLLIGVYAAVWITFYVPPLVAEAPDIVIEAIRHPPELRWVPLWVLGVVLGLYTATLFVAMPIVVPILYVRAWWYGIQDFVANHGLVRGVGITVAVLIACVGLLAWTNQQPQQRAFALLDTPPESPEEAQALLDEEEAIRKGLLNAYLAPQRYISAVGEVRHVSDMYEYSLGLSWERASTVQRMYEIVARPLLYEPVEAPEPDRTWDNRAFREEPQRAAELYKAFFDESILEGERDVIVRTVRTTWSVDQARAAVLAVDDREVLLTRQAVSVTERGDWAEVELYEVYQNQTWERQEVVTYFSLPESAVVTGLWLGNSDDRDARFAYRVAPRGAAQAAYRNEVRRRIDPALVEQIGPRQYRLRIFPVEPRRRIWDGGPDESVVEAGPPLHMWLTYRVMAEGDAWPLPQLAEKRSVYWDGSSIREVDGEPMGAGEETWLPSAVPATAAVDPTAHRVDFRGGRSVIARPMSDGEVPGLPGDLTLAVVLDRSRSMAERKDEVRAALTHLADTAATDGGVDVYLTASEYQGEDPTVVELSSLDLSDIQYAGGQNAAQLLAQFQQLRTDEAYDAIFVLTDGAGYELGSGDVETGVPDAPVWMVHLGDDLPLGYDDGTLEAIQASGGGVAGSVREAMVRLAVSLEGAGYDVVDGTIWSVVPTERAEAEIAVEEELSFAPLAARRLILAEMARNRGEIRSLEMLDALHEVAVEHSVVTPYSSMIVLVTERQQELLDALEGRADRYEREYEEVGETAAESALAVTGVPEPGEWLLLGLAAAMLLGYAYRERLVRGRRTSW